MSNNRLIVILAAAALLIEVISRKHMRAKMLITIRGKRCNSCDVPTHHDPDFVYAKKDDLRKFLIDLATLLLITGVKEFDCTRISSLDAICCRQWNNLLDAVGSGGDTQDATDRVMAACMGIG